VIGSLHAMLDGSLVSRADAEASNPRRLDPVPRGLFETILVSRDRPHLVEAHAKRLCDSSAALDLGAPDRARLVAEIRSAAAHAGGRRARLRVLRWEDSGAVRQLVTLDPEPPSPARIVLGVATERRPRDREDRRHKRLDAPDLDRIRKGASNAGVFDLLILDEAGRVLEGAKTNVFWRTGSTIRTPSTRLSLLPGTRRARLFLAARRAGYTVEETESDLTELLVAQEVMVTNSLQGVRRRVIVRAPHQVGPQPR